AVNIKRWVIVRGLLRIFKTAALVNSDIHQHGTGLHIFDHVLGDQFRRCCTGNDHCTDDEVCFAEFFSNRDRVGDLGSHPALVLLIDMLQHLRVQVQYRDLSVQPSSHRHSRSTNLATTNNDHASWLGSGHTWQEHTAAAFGGLEVI